MSNKKLWPIEFGPFYTPEQLAKAGTFEGRYWGTVLESKGGEGNSEVKKWLKYPNVVSGTDKERDAKAYNEFEVKSRSSLSDWKKNGWIKTDPAGHYEWFIRFFYGRRLEEGKSSEDAWQIGRWRSYVARHMGGIKARGGATDKQKQGMLQWYWNHEHTFNDKRIEDNAKKMARLTKSEICTMDEFLVEYGFKEPPKEEPSLESIIRSPFAETTESSPIITPETHPSYFF